MHRRTSVRLRRHNSPLNPARSVATLICAHLCQNNQTMTEQPKLRVVNWNVEWAKATSPRGRVILERINSLHPDIVCLTEAHSDFLPKGFVETSDADYGYGDQRSRRKVVLWSTNPWTDVHRGAGLDLPGGRFVAATTSTPLGKARFVGVCIPWKGAHVRTGRTDRQPWEDHERYLDHLPKSPDFRRDSRLVLLGDFNQRIPRNQVPLALYAKLEAAISPFKVATAGTLPGAPSLAIDHICHTHDVRCSVVSILEKHDPNVGKLSDHFGICADFCIEEHAE